MLAPHARPRLDAPLPWLWRAPGELEVAPGRHGALVLRGVPSAVADFISLLDGSVRVADLGTAVPALAPQWCTWVLNALEQAGLVYDIAVTPMAQPPGGVVRVIGTGDLAHGLLDCLSDSGLPVVRSATWEQARAAPGTHGPEPVAMTVLAGDRASPDRWAAHELCTSGTPHLLVCAAPCGVRVGPLVVPGRTSCLRCLDLRLTEVDPGWPRLALTLEATPLRPSPPATLWAVAHCATVVRHALAGRVDGDRLWDLRDGELSPVLTSLTPHPDCPCRPP